MSEVKIYTVVSDDLSPPIKGESFCTDMVRHSEYAALEAERDALAAENAGLKAAKGVTLKVAGKLARGSYFDELQMKMNRHDSVRTATVIKFMDEARETMKQHAGKLVDAHNIETPAADAFLREQMAKGVEMFALMCAEEAIKDGSETTGWKSRASNASSDYAAQLRNGEAV